MIIYESRAYLEEISVFGFSLHNLAVHFNFNLFPFGVSVGDVPARESRLALTVLQKYKSYLKEVV